MKRRQLVKQIAAALTALSTSTAFAEAVIDFDSSKEAANFDAAQLTLLGRMVDVIIPATDTPGASVARVHEFIAYMLSHYYDEAANQRFFAGLRALDQSSQQHFNAGLTSINGEQMLQLFTVLERQRKISAERDFVVWLKELTVMGYYTSEIGATEELRFLAIPGSYSACIDFAEVGRTWAT
jgi:hypothetical protein